MAIRNVIELQNRFMSALPPNLPKVVNIFLMVVASIGFTYQARKTYIYQYSPQSSGEQNQKTLTFLASLAEASNDQAAEERVLAGDILGKPEDIAYPVALLWIEKDPAKAVEWAKKVTEIQKKIEIATALVTAKKNQEAVLLYQHILQACGPLQDIKIAQTCTRAFHQLGDGLAYKAVVFFEGKMKKPTEIFEEQCQRARALYDIGETQLAKKAAKQLPALLNAIEQKHQPAYWLEIAKLRFYLKYTNDKITLALNEIQKLSDKFKPFSIADQLAEFKQKINQENPADLSAAILSDLKVDYGLQTAYLTYQTSFDEQLCLAKMYKRLKADSDLKALCDQIIATNFRKPTPSTEAEILSEGKQVIALANITEKLVPPIMPYYENLSWEPKIELGCKILAFYNEYNKEAAPQFFQTFLSDIENNKTITPADKIDCLVSCVLQNAFVQEQHIALLRAATRIAHSLSGQNQLEALLYKIALGYLHLELSGPIKELQCIPIPSQVARHGTISALFLASVFVGFFVPIARPILLGLAASVNWLARRF
jgi:hypothetical protein